MVDFKKLSEKTKAKDAVFKILDQQAAEVENCADCKLSTTRKRTVFGFGNPMAELIVVGESPSEDDETYSEPFRGERGALFSRILETIGYGLDDFMLKPIYLMNTLKCRPSERKGGRSFNRPPEADELQACALHFHKQLMALPNKKLILAFGAVAAHSVLAAEQGTLKVGNLRQRAFASYGLKCPVVVTYHPNYLFRNPDQKPKVYSDLKFALRILQGEEVELCGIQNAEEPVNAYASLGELKKDEYGLMPDQKDTYSEELETI